MTAIQITTRTPGDLVTYHGSITREHGNLFYIADGDDRGRLTLVDRDYPNVTTLRRVRPTSVTPTGVTLDMCDCGHEAGNPGTPGYHLDFCEVRSCECRNHSEPRTH